VTSGLNIDGLCSEALHCANTMMDKLDNFLAIVGSFEKFLGLATIPGEKLGAKMVQ
jgi:hypothetical protein